MGRHGCIVSLIWFVGILVLLPSVNMIPNSSLGTVVEFTKTAGYAMYNLLYIVYPAIFGINTIALAQL